ncbi:MAG: peptidase T [Candidatus Eisenbacteria bacterium]|uniref:Peptidase T n=1 Tax=Eiseniibacteriota bacterium TaxID=2212470 RepID=A0A933W0P3_UNCEI|nr:peptidase T [Candidatus Eisenbacteria bacterium]
MSADLREAILERFLRYVKYDTQSNPASTTVPSTAKQLVLSNVLVDELKALGLSDAFLDDKGIVMATLPANTKKANVPVIGLLAHVDTSPEMSGENVKPIVHRAWAGGDIVLPDDPTAVIRPSELPALAARKGEDIVTASGKTLLGADDKSGVAVIMAVLEHLLAHPEIPHGTIRVAFTPDEEIGRGVRPFDVKRFGAYCAYTLDGEGRGRMDAETFSADAMTVTFQGFNTHPGLATNVMVNSIKVASDFVNRLPKNGLAPETTADREGFVHPMGMEASVDRTTVKFIIRDFETPGLAVKEALVEKLAKETCADWPGSSVTFTVSNSYRNMRDVLAKVPDVVENLREAMRRANVTIDEGRIRGGTDGSILSEMGLPTPNLFCGMHEFHSRLEWVSAHDMEKSAEVVLQLAQVWEEKA